MDIEKLAELAAKYGMGIGHTSANRPCAYHEIAPGLLAVVEARWDNKYVGFVAVDTPQEYLYLRPYDWERGNETDSFDVARAAAIVAVTRYVLSCRRALDALLESVEG